MVRKMLAEQWPVTMLVAQGIGNEEALIRQAYKDSEKVWTWSIGITSKSGHDVERYIDKPQPLEHCIAVFAWALEKYAAEVRQAFAGHELDEYQWAAANMFHWNTGGIEQASWVRHWKAGRIAEARAAFMLWNKPAKIVPRRERERELFFAGKYDFNDTRIPEYTRLTQRHTPDWSSRREIEIGPVLEAVFGGKMPEEPSTVPLPPEMPAEVKAARAEAPAQTAEGDLYNGQPRAAVKQVQTRLRELGYPEVGNADGRWGTKTRAAVLAFRADNDLPLTATIDQVLLVALMSAKSREVAPERANATEKDLKDSTVVKHGVSLKRFGQWIGLGSIGAGTVDGAADLDAMGDRLDALRAIGETLTQIWPYLAVAVGGLAVWYVAQNLLNAEVQGYRDGRHV